MARRRNHRSPPNLDTLLTDSPSPRVCLPRPKRGKLSQHLDQAPRAASGAAHAAIICSLAASTVTERVSAPAALLRRDHHSRARAGRHAQRNLRACHAEGSPLADQAMAIRRHSPSDRAYPPLSPLPATASAHGPGAGRMLTPAAPGYPAAWTPRLNVTFCDWSSSWPRAPTRRYARPNRVTALVGDSAYQVSLRGEFAG